MSGSTRKTISQERGYRKRTTTEGARDDENWKRAKRGQKRKGSGKDTMSIGRVLEKDMYRRTGESIQRGNVMEIGGEKEGEKSVIAGKSDHPRLNIFGLIAAN